ncbi:dimethylamine monooxygenase subunit DmmA family protein [Aureimonas leprariae]|uniref:Uncharacterized protein n=1 Tax=Plantimonas leprariae TaxID=2615207 RepID=A0A7V7TYG5_9HYPH|nr:dimethylamine monooxygenase subunit DmmA family protein [Aureimonas leprariae]KAB0682741.1 hypothetical protein F6X38_01265 [Aureimonas leprariae]
MQLSDIKSRPIYDALRPDRNAKRHIAAAEGEGALGIEAAFADDADVLGRTTIIYTPGASASHGDRLAALRADALHVLPSTETALTRLAGLLAASRMGTRLYVAGSEDFIGQVRALAAASGLDADAVHCEHRGSLARRVQCVHCKGFISDVTASPVPCAHCGNLLLVRDHYSRRLGAFMGVSVNAEAPDEVPAAEEFQP